MTPETERLIGEIERTLEAATPGPWAQCARFRRLIIPEWQQGRKVGGSADRNRDHTEYVQPVADIFELEKLRHRGAAEVQANADLVSSAPSWLSALLSALREAEGEMAAMRAALPDDPPEGYTFPEAVAAMRRRMDKAEAEAARLREALDAGSPWCVNVEAGYAICHVCGGMVGTAEPTAADHKIDCPRYRPREAGRE